MSQFEITDLQHCLASKKERDAHVWRLSKFGVRCEFHDDDEMTYSGSHENVLRAVLDHYDGVVSEAYACHPDLEIR